MGAFRLVLISCFALLPSQFAFAGISTNGTAIALEENNAWFLGPKPIEYCIEKADTFRAETPALKKMVKQSFEKWHAFFKKYGLDRAEFKNLSRYRDLSLSLQFKEVPVCSQPQEQLRFLFGIENDAIFQALEKDEGALALTIRGIYNHTTYRNGGLIYIRSSESDLLKLHHMILHELGHIFGMSHDSVSVMNSKLAYDVVTKRSAPSWFGQIETDLWPYRAAAGENYRLTQSTPGGLPNTELGALNKRIGFPPQGKFNLDLVWKQTMGSDRTNSLTFVSAETGKTQILEGFFKEEVKTPMPNYGPSIHLLLECRECVDSDCSAFCGSRAFGLTRYLDPTPNPKYFNGYYVLGKTKLPATIVMTREIVIRVFDPETLSWWGFGI